MSDDGGSAAERERLDAAIAALSEPGRLGAIEARVAAAAPQLQGILTQALGEGGWFAGSHEEQIAKVSALEDPEERLVALRTLLAEETRIGMMVGVAVGWALAEELEEAGDERTSN